MKKMTALRKKLLRKLIEQSNFSDIVIQRVRQELFTVEDAFQHFDNHRNVNWPLSHTQYNKFDNYSVH
jgi:hypothetical protein